MFMLWFCGLLLLACDYNHNHINMECYVCAVAVVTWKNGPKLLHFMTELTVMSRHRTKSRVKVLKSAVNWNELSFGSPIEEGTTVK